MTPPTIAASLARHWAQALAEDTALQNWCMANYGKPPTIFAGVDPGKGPKFEDCPFVVVVPDKEQRSVPEGEHTSHLRVVLGIHDSGRVEENGVQVLTGLAQISDGMFPAVWRVLADGLDTGPHGGELETMNVFYEVADFPLIMQAATVSVTTLLPIDGRL